MIGKSLTSHRSYPYVVVVIFLITYMLSYIDRMVLSLIVDEVKGDLNLTEVQVSILMGFAFASFYIIAGLPLGRLADSTSRVRLIIAGLLVWTMATIACGFAGSFWQLFIARAFVGIGEAALSPAVYSLLPDYFRRERVGFALALFACGTTFGGGLGMMSAGYIMEHHAQGNFALPFLPDLAVWQVTFITVALPGFIMAPLIWLVVREPARIGSGAKPKGATTREVFSYIAEHRKAVVPITLGLATHGIVIYAYGVWGPAYFMRVHGMTPGEVGAILGTLFLVMGTIGSLGSGYIHDRMLASGKLDASMRLAFWAVVSAIPAILPAYLITDRTTAIAFYAIGVMFAKSILPVQPAMLRALFPGRMRGQATGIYIAVVTIFGLGVGPTVIAFITEHVFGGTDDTGRSLAVVSVTAALIGGTLIRYAIPHARGQIQAIADEEDALAAQTAAVPDGRPVPIPAVGALAPGQG